MYALQQIIKLYSGSFSAEDFVKEIKHHIENELLKVDQENHHLFNCTAHLEKVEDAFKYKITILPHNLYTLVFFSTGEKPDLSRLKGEHKYMNIDPIQYDNWTLYFDNDQPIAINKKLSTSVNINNKFDL